MKSDWKSATLSIIDDIKTDIDNSNNTKHQPMKTSSGWQKSGVRTGAIRRIGRKYWSILKNENLTDIDVLFQICDILLRQRITGLRTIAFQWSFRVKSQYEERHMDIFNKWIDEYITGWSSCDDLCTHSIGYLIYTYPDLTEQLKNWAKEDNVWAKRAAAVCLIYGARRGEFLHQGLQIANMLMHNKEKYVRKGYGWLLKEIANKYQEEVYQFVLEHKDTMPRVSLRYAIEKMPEDMRQKALS